MPDGKKDPDERSQSRKTVLHISSTDENSSSMIRRSERNSVFSWREDSCWSVSENTKSKDFRKKRFKKQKGEYLITKEARPELIEDLLGTPEGHDEHEDKDEQKSNPEEPNPSNDSKT